MPQKFSLLSDRYPRIWVWCPIFIYVCVIFLTTPILPDIVRFLASILGLSLKELLQYLKWTIIIGGSVFIIAHIILNQRHTYLRTYLTLGVVFGVGYLLVSNFASPAEATHLLEYGGLSIFSFFRLSKLYPEAKPSRLYLWSGLLTLAVGVADEIYQGWLPNRYYDFNDIITNVVSGLLGLIYLEGIVRPNLLDRLPAVPEVAVPQAPSGLAINNKPST